MCLEDIEIGKSSHGGGATKTIGTTLAQVVGASDARYSLILCAPPTGIITFSTQGDFAAGDGIRLVPGMPPVILTLVDCGAIIKKPWFCIADAGSVRVTTFETFFEGIKK